MSLLFELASYIFGGLMVIGIGWIIYIVIAELTGLNDYMEEKKEKEE